MFPLPDDMALVPAPGELRATDPNLASLATSPGGDSATSAAAAAAAAAAAVAAVAAGDSDGYATPAFTDPSRWSSYLRGPSSPTRNVATHTTIFLPPLILPPPSHPFAALLACARSLLRLHRVRRRGEHVSQQPAAAGSRLTHSVPETASHSCGRPLTTPLSPRLMSTHSLSLPCLPCPRSGSTPSTVAAGRAPSTTPTAPCTLCPPPRTTT